MDPVIQVITPKGLRSGRGHCRKLSALLVQRNFRTLSWRRTPKVYLCVNFCKVSDIELFAEFPQNGNLLDFLLFFLFCELLSYWWLVWRSYALTGCVGKADTCQGSTRLLRPALLPKSFRRGPFKIIPIWGCRKESEKASCGETVVQKGELERPFFLSEDLLIATVHLKTLFVGAEKKRTLLRDGPFGQPFLRSEHLLRSFRLHPE